MLVVNITCARKSLFAIPWKAFEFRATIFDTCFAGVWIDSNNIIPSLTALLYSTSVFAFLESAFDLLGYPSE